MRKSSIAGIMVGIISIIIFAHFLPDPVCADGWSSGSIGTQGACSWHGGVNRHPLLFLLALAGAVACGAAARYIGIRLSVLTGTMKTPYGTLNEYKDHLRKLGVPEDQIQSELRKYRSKT